MCSISLSPLATTAIRKMRRSAHQMNARDRLRTPLEPISVEPNPWRIRSGAVIGVRTAANPASARTRVTPTKIINAITTSRIPTHSGVPMIPSHATMTTLPPNNPATAAR